MEQITVKALLNLCLQEVKNGNGDKYIVISDDVEGNGYHGLFYGFTDAAGFEDEIYETREADTKNLLILG